MTEQFSFDVFLSHSSKDKHIVREVAERLRDDGLVVWFDDWILKPGDSIPAKLEEGLERSRALVLFMSANAFGSDWAQLEAGTFRFRDPLNKQRRFIPLRLDAAPIKGSLAQFLYIDWVGSSQTREYPKLVEACRPSPASVVPDESIQAGLAAENIVQLPAAKLELMCLAFSADGKRVLTGGYGGTMHLWDVDQANCIREFTGGKRVQAIAWSADQSQALTADWNDSNIRLWNLATGELARVFAGHVPGGAAWGVAWSIDQKHFLSAGDQTVRLWEVATGRCLRIFKGHSGNVYWATWNPDGRRFLSGSADATVRVWDAESGECLRVFEGHEGLVADGIWVADGVHVVSASNDRTIRVWDTTTGRCLRVLEGHTQFVHSISLSRDQVSLLSASLDKTIRLWDLTTGQCIHVLRGHKAWIRRVEWSSDGQHAFSGDEAGGIGIWDLSTFVSAANEKAASPVDRSFAPDQIQYTNAKVLLVGESGAGKTGLSKVLSGEQWQPSDSTVGAWATQWKLPVVSDPINGTERVSEDIQVEREIWLWDFGGQADQRLIHQRHLCHPGCASNSESGNRPSK